MAKGDRKVIDGVEHQSLGSGMETDPNAPPAVFSEKQFWVPLKKEPEGFPAMRKGGRVKKWR